MPKLLHTLVALSYCGDRYSGSALQYNQPHTITIESELIAALRKAALIEADMPLQKVRLDHVSRTDKGVSAACALFTFDCFMQDTDVAELLNDSLPADIRCIGFMRVIPKFRGRQLCSSRRYEYCFPISMFFATLDSQSWVEKRKTFNEFLAALPDPGQYEQFANLVKLCDVPIIQLPESVDEMQRSFNELIAPSINELANRAFIARTAHYHNFAPRDSYQSIASTQRKIMQFELSMAFKEVEACSNGTEKWRLNVQKSNATGDYYARLAIHGQSFLYNQIRMMIGALCAVSRGLAPPAWLFMALIGKFSCKTDVPVAPAAFLFLQQQLFAGYDTRPEYALYGPLISEKEEIIVRAEQQMPEIRKNIMGRDHTADLQLFDATLEAMARENDWYAQACECINEEYRVRDVIDQKRVLHI